MEGLLVQFMVMRLPSCTLVKQGVTDGNSMGLILEARNVHSPTHFSDLRVDVSDNGRSWATTRLVEQARFIQPYTVHMMRQMEIESSSEAV